MKKYYLFFFLILSFVSGCSNYFWEKDQSLEIVSNFKKDSSNYEDITKWKIFFQTWWLYYQVTWNVLVFSDSLAVDKIRLSFSEFENSSLNQKYYTLFKSLMRSYGLEYDYENSSSIQDADMIIDWIYSPWYIITYNNKYNTCQYVNSPSQDFIWWEFRWYKSDIQVSCIKNTDITKAIDEQKDFIEWLDIWSNRRDIKETYQVDQNIFYILNLYAVEAIAKKDSTWNYKMIQTTQDEWDCKIMKTNNIPEYVYWKCYNYEE